MSELRRCSPLDNTVTRKHLLNAEGQSSWPSSGFRTSNHQMPISIILNIADIPKLVKALKREPPLWRSNTKANLHTTFVCYIDSIAIAKLAFETEFSKAFQTPLAFSPQVNVCF